MFLIPLEALLEALLEAVFKPLESLFTPPLEALQALHKHCKLLS
jgi:hypothetical protein